MKLEAMNFRTMESLFEFCRDNSNLKVLELLDCAIGGGATALPPHDEGRQDTMVLTLDKLTLGGVVLLNSAAASDCAKLIAANINLSALVLDGIYGNHHAYLGRVSLARNA